MSESINGNVLGLCEVDGFCPWKLFDLNENSFVVDLGAYRGDFSQYILDTYNCRVDAYEPLNHGCYLVNHPKFTLIKNPVLDGTKVKFNIQSQEPSSNIFVNDGEEIESVDIFEITKEKIDLLKVNIEGAEMIVLNRANLDNIKQIIVEFHLFKGELTEHGITKIAIEALVDKIIASGFKVKQIDDTSPAYFFYR